MLNHKQILFISPEFFNYEKHITHQLLKLGTHVDFYNERPSNSLLTKGLIRVKKNFLTKKINAYYQKILSEIKDKKYDFFLLIKGETIPSFFLEKFRESQPNCKMIYYNYDSFEEYPNLLNLLPYFDKKITFDHRDAQKYQLDFLPLFYTDNYRKNSSQENKLKYTLSCIGSIHTDRYSVASKVKQIIEDKGFSTFIYFYAPSRITLLLKKIFDKNFKNFNLKYIKYKSLSEKEIKTLYEQSEIILDICKPFQNGLTMRTFETLALEKKMITTNENIVHYPFYHPQNIWVIHRDNIQIPNEFLESKYIEIDAKIVENYSLNSWIHSVFK